MVKRRPATVPGSADLLPVPATDTYREQHGVIIVCPNAAEQEAVYNTLRELGFRPRVVSV
jgi:hypothetical protein